VARQSAPRRTLRPDAWLASFEQVLQSGPSAGYSQTSFMGHMEWALLGLPGVDDLIEYETRVNYVIPKYEGSSDLHVRSDEI